MPSAISRSFSLNEPRMSGILAGSTPRVYYNTRTAARVKAQAPSRPQEPAMRPLSLDDSANSLLAHRRAADTARPPSTPPSTAHPPDGGSSNVPQTPIPMVYRGPNPPAANNDKKDNSNGATVLVHGQTSAPNGAINNGKTRAERVAVATGRLSSPVNGQILVATSAPAAGSNAGARNGYANLTPSIPGTSSGGFKRTMMVAGFDEDADEAVDAMGKPLSRPPQRQYNWESYSKTRRTIDTWAFVLTLRTRLWLLDQKWSYGGAYSEAAKSRRARKLGAWIRESLLSLGPTFIKIGQLFSTRSDLFPAEFVEELSKLQDRVPAFPANQARATVERDLGAPLDQLFAEFDPQPIAAASLGQVHLARLPNGERVVVKVQRPGLKRLFDIDLDNLRLVAEQLDKGDDGAGTRDFVGIYEECRTILYQEIDYINEGRNADLFRRNFRPQDWVRVPRVHWQRTSSSVMTMEYLPGIKITDVASITAAGLDAPSVAKRATEAYLVQILRHGFFHADPHPGNIAIDPVGRLIFYDFGMMGSIVPATRERLLDLFYGIAKKDVDAVLINLTALGIIAPTSGDTISIRRALAYFVDNIGRQAEQQETVAAIGEDLFAIALDSPFRFPATFTFVLRAFATLEGIGKALDPEFSFAATAAPYAQELLDLQDGRAQQAFVFGQLQAQAAEVGAAAAAMPLRVRRIESTIASLEAGDLKVRVRVLEGERAARRAGVMQAATLNAIVSVGVLNVGVQLALAGREVAAGIAFSAAGAVAVLVVLGMRRVKRLDKIEESLKGKGKFPSS